VARPLRLEFAGALYHLTSRGNARQAIYLTDDDRHRFLTVLERVVSRYRWLCHAYCLMGNHYHLLAETPLPNLSLGMRQLNGVYAQDFNRRHGRVGHLFQARFKAIIVEKTPHLLELSRYVVLNPVRAGLCSDPAGWRWSSYRASAGLDNPEPFVALDWLLGQFGDRRRIAQQRYRAFVSRGVTRDPWQELRSGLYLGSDAFVASLAPDEPIEEVPREQWQPIRPALAQILAPRDDASLLEAYQRYSYPLKEIALELGVHYATVSRALAVAEARDDKQRLLAGSLACKT
jgi:putative transposase